MESKISIIIPAFNVEKYLKDCVLSVFSQKYSNMEIILIDDGSMDKTGDICEELKKEDERVIVIHQPNQGLSNSRNLGIKIATGKYIYFMDSDDTLNLGMFKELIPKMDEHELDCIAFCAREISSKGNSSYKTKAPLSMYNRIIKGMDILEKYIPAAAVWTYLYRREYLIEHDLRFKPGILYEDMLFTPQLLLTNPKMIISDGFYYNYIKRDDSITKRELQPQNYKDRCIICEYYIKRLKERRSSEYKAIDRLLITYFLETEVIYEKLSNMAQNSVLKNRHKLINDLKSLRLVETPKVYIVCRNIHLIFRLRKIKQKLFY